MKGLGFLESGMTLMSNILFKSGINGKNHTIVTQTKEI